MKRLVLVFVTVIALAFLFAQNEPPPAPPAEPPAQPSLPVPQDAVARIDDTFIKKDEYVDYLFKYCFRQMSMLLDGYISFLLWMKEAENLKLEVKDEELEGELQKQLAEINANPLFKKQFEDYLKRIDLSFEKWKLLAKREMEVELLVKKVGRYYRLTEEFIKEEFEKRYPKDRTFYCVEIIRLNKKEKLSEIKDYLADIEKKLKEAKDDAEKAKLQLDKDRMQKKKEILEKADEKAWAEEVVRRLREGEKMEKVAQEEATGWMKTDFDRGYRALDEWDQAVQKPLEKMKIGEVANPVACDSMGYFIIRLKDKKEPGKLSLDEVRPYLVKEFEVTDLRQEDVATLDKKFRDKHKIELYLNKRIEEER
ncbi:MAG: peptidyl-prolyl cis-trans isomerase [Planctomycetota bacterium]|nr:peptidyl-prolyl cis-trans isomerase [Planctomycetota bacterium]